METKQILQKHQQKFKRIRLSVNLLLLLVVGLIVILQFDNLLKFINWLNAK